MDTQQDTLGTRLAFYSICFGFQHPIGTNFGSLFDNVLVMWTIKLEYSFQSLFLLIWEWTWHQDVMPGCA